MGFLSIKTDDLDELPDYTFNVKNLLGPAFNTRSHDSQLYKEFNTTENHRYFLETKTLPKKIMLKTINGIKVEFNIDFQRLREINMLPPESRMFELFYSSEQAYGGKKMRKKTVKKGGMMRRGRPGALMNMDMDGFLSNDSAPPSPEFILNAVPYHARSQDGNSIMINAPQSPQPAKYLRDVNVGRHFGAPPDQNLEYDWDMYIYDIISKELSEDQKNLMNTFINSKNFDIVSGWIMNNSIPKQFILYLPNMTEFVTFKFKDIDSNALLRRCYNQLKGQSDPLCIYHYIFGSIILQRGSSYKNKIKNTKKNNIIKKKKVEKSTVKKQKVEKKKVQKKKVEKKKVEKKKVEKKKVKNI